MGGIRNFNMRAGFAFIALIIGGLRCEDKLIQDDVTNAGVAELEAKVDLLQTIVLGDNRRLRNLAERERAGRRLLENRLVANDAQHDNMAHTIRNLTTRLAEEEKKGMELERLEKARDDVTGLVLEIQRKSLIIDALYIQLETFEEIVKLTLGTEKEERKRIVDNLLVVKQQLREMQAATDRVTQVTSQNSLMMRNVQGKLESYSTEVEEAQGSIAQIETGYSSVLHQLDSLKENMSAKPQNCQDVMTSGNYYSGIYTIYPFLDNRGGVSVYCNMTHGGGWTVLQRRLDGSEDFYRYWDDYKNGFGTLDHEFWIGNDIIHALTAQGNYELRIDLEDFEGEWRYAIFSNFSVGNEVSKYILHFNKNSYSGNAGNSLQHNNGDVFSTRDKDSTSYKCAVHDKGGWWYHHCTYANLNGLYVHGRACATLTQPLSCTYWVHWKYPYSLKTTQMMIRKK